MVDIMAKLIETNIGNKNMVDILAKPIGKIP